jgi:hypothetical protein
MIATLRKITECFPVCTDVSVGLTPEGDLWIGAIYCHRSINTVVSAAQLWNQRAFPSEAAYLVEVASDMARKLAEVT